MNQGTALSANEIYIKLLCNKVEGTGASENVEVRHYLHRHQKTKNVGAEVRSHRGVRTASGWCGMCRK